MPYNDYVWVDQGGLRVGSNQLTTAGTGVGVGTSSIYYSFTAGNGAVFFGNVGFQTVSPTCSLDVNGQLRSNNYQSDPAGVVQTFAQTLTAPYTIPSNRNALSVGNLAIGTSASVTVPVGSRWVIL